jgi:hypothetical protein
LPAESHVDAILVGPLATGDDEKDVDTTGS